MINDSDIKQILTDFPKLELSYEHITHKKVYDADIMLVIPEGKPVFAWFTTYKENNVCFLLEMDNKRNLNTTQITNVTICKTGFDDKLAYGTIFYGILFYTYNKTTRLNTQCFSIEDIYQYKGRDCSKETFLSKLQIFKTIFTSAEISQSVIFNSYTVFGLPLMYSNNDINIDVNTIKSTLGYKISSFKYRYINNRKIVKHPNPHLHLTGSNDSYTTPKRTEMIQPQVQTKPQQLQQTKPQQLQQQQVQTKNKIFMIKPDIQNDIYNLCSLSGDFIEYALIPDYKTSVMMNKLFRNIKENECLDNLEESDDENEFENVNIDKFVYLDKCYKMNCVYNYKFKKWVPVSVVT